MIGLALLFAAFVVVLYLYKLTPNHPILWGIDLIILPVASVGIIFAAFVASATLLTRQRRDTLARSMRDRRG
jgi:hypothetical protein